MSASISTKEGGASSANNQPQLYLFCPQNGFQQF